MTTNHIERLDPALIRPGRVDVIQLLDDASASQAKRLFCQFYGGKEDGRTTDRELSEGAGIEVLGVRLAEIVEEKQRQGLRIAMANLQGHFIQHTDPRSAVQTCGELFIRR
jgi:mitochondrial chaperone BCS1